MQEMMLHCGAEQVSLDDLRAVKVPEATRTYQPVSHYDMAFNLGNVTRELLTPKGYTFVKEQYGLGREGQKFFGLFQYRNGGTEMGMAVAFRNSYDKSMSAGIAIGAQVFVCDNLAFSGDICVMKKHTANIIESLRNEMITAVFNSVCKYEQVHKHLDYFRTLPIDNNRGFEIIGRLAGEEVITATEVNESFRQWKKPEYPEFGERNVYSLYNSVTCALRSAPPQRILEAHKRLHEAFIGLYPCNN